MEHSAGVAKTRPSRSTVAALEVLPPSVEADGTHRRLLEAALVAFSERGFHGVSVRELARATDIHPSSMYAHLASKEALLMELMTLGHEEYADRVRTAVAEAGADVTDRLAAFVRAHVGMHVSYPLLARVSNRELHALSPARRNKVVAIRDECSALLLGLIEEGVESGRFSTPDVFLAGAMIGRMGMGVSEWWSPELGYSAHQVIEAFVDGSLRIVGANGARPARPH
jgi:AcrR family transcriptional regulator